VYHVNLKVKDPCGNETTAIFLINVPHDQNGTAVDDGPAAGYSLNSNCSTYKFAKRGGEIPEGYELEQNYPNPFNPTTSISYTIPVDGWVVLAVYDIFGRKVKSLVDVNQHAGKHVVEFDARTLASGQYLYTLEVEGVVLTKALSVLK
jgi:hypothetical protein